MAAARSILWPGRRSALIAQLSVGCHLWPSADGTRTTVGGRTSTSGKRVLLADDVRNTGQTLARCAALVQEAGGSLLGTIQIYDRLETTGIAGVPNFALAEYKAPENFKAADCPLCAAKVPITRF